MDGMKEPKPECGAKKGGQPAEYDVGLHVAGLCKLAPIHFTPVSINLANLAQFWSWPFPSLVCDIYKRNESFRGSTY